MDGYYLSRLVITNPDNGYSDKYDTINYRSVTDIEGNVYRTVTFGSQEWTIDNFRSSRLNDNTIIPLVTAVLHGSPPAPAYCFYDNSTDSVKIKFGHCITGIQLILENWLHQDGMYHQMQNGILYKTT